LRFKPEIVAAAHAVIEAKGALNAPQSLAAYVAEVYAIAKIDGFLESKSPEWLEILNDDQRQAMRRLIGTWIVEEYEKLFPKPLTNLTEGTSNE
jgi:hypothetical protein